MKLLFFFSLLMLAYIYAGYPLAAALLARRRPRPVRKGVFEPRVTILIAAYNEEKVIGATLANKLALDYPPDKLEILVVSDESTDQTDAIVASFAHRGVRLIRQEPRAGKTAALNRAVVAAKGEILVFSDANSQYAPHALRYLVENFADPQVGYVTGKMVYTNSDGTMTGDGCSAYMRYENRLREAETAIGSVVGVDGGIDAVRRELYRPMNPDQLPDFVLPLRVVEQGYRVVYEPKALLWEAALQDVSDEYRMRVRVSLRAFWALRDMRQLLAWKNDPLFCWQLWSHKVLRYLAFLFLAGTFFGNLAVWSAGPGYRIFFILQFAAYLGVAICGGLERVGVRYRPFGFVHYFVLVNLAAAQAFGKFLLGRKQVVWTPRKG